MDFVLGRAGSLTHQRRTVDCCVTCQLCRGFGGQAEEEEEREAHRGEEGEGKAHHAADSVRWLAGMLDAKSPGWQLAYGNVSKCTCKT